MEHAESDARRQARAQVESIYEFVRAVECDRDRLDELRDEVTPYVAGWNMPGYLPDSDPARFADADDAREYIADALRTDADERDDDLSDTLEHCADEIGRANGERAAAEWGRTLGGRHYWIQYDPSPTAGLSGQDAEELRDLTEAAGEWRDGDDARQAAEDNALSVEVRSGWSLPGSYLEPDEFRIVLCTGGPHVELVGELNARKEPSRVRVLYRDWGESGELHDFDDDAVLAYCGYFYFGE